MKERVSMNEDKRREDLQETEAEEIQVLLDPDQELEEVFLQRRSR